MTVDAALGVLSDLLREHGVDGARIERHERGITWWGPRLAQRFTVTGPLETGAGRTWWLAFETDFLAGFVPGSRAQLATTTMLGWTFDLFTAGIDRGEVVLRGRTYAIGAEHADGGLGVNGRSATVDAPPEMLRSGRGLGERAADLGRRALAASQVAHTYAQWYLDGTMRLPEDGVRVNATLPPAARAGVASEMPTRAAPVTSDPVISDPVMQDRVMQDLPDPSPLGDAIGTADALDLAPVTRFLTDRGMTQLDAPHGKVAFGGRLPTSQRDVVVLLDTTATQPHAGPGVSLLVSPVGLANDNATALAAEINTATWVTAEPPVGMGTWSNRREIGLSYVNFLPYRWTSAAALRSIVADDLGQVLQADRRGFFTPHPAASQRAQ